MRSIIVSRYLYIVAGEGYNSFHFPGTNIVAGEEYNSFQVYVQYIVTIVSTFQVKILLLVRSTIVSRYMYIVAGEGSYSFHFPGTNIDAGEGYNSFQVLYKYSCW